MVELPFDATCIEECSDHVIKNDFQQTLEFLEEQMLLKGDKIKYGQHRGELTTNNFVLMSRSEKKFGMIQNQ